MLSYNQQGVPDGNMAPVNAFGQQWPAAQSNWITNQMPHVHNQNGYWKHPSSFTSQRLQGQANSQQWPNHLTQYQPSYQFNSASSQVFPSPNLQVNQFTQLRSHSTPIRSHQARISLVPNPSGGFKAVVKRKRKRTHFTTEQIEAMEAVFQKKPYVTREDRQVIVQQLQLNDTAVKVWFQNRRLRGKRAAEEAAAEQAFYEEEMASEQSLYNGDNTTYQQSTDFISPEKRMSEQSFFNGTDATYQDTTEFKRPEKIMRLDALESELCQRVDESGYITLDEKSMSDIVSAIDNVLSHDINLGFEISSSSSEDETKNSSTSSSSTDSAIDNQSSYPDIMELLSNEDKAAETEQSESSPLPDLVDEDVSGIEVTAEQQVDEGLPDTEVSSEEQVDEGLPDTEVAIEDTSEPEFSDVVEVEVRTSAASSYEPISPAGSPASETTYDDKFRCDQFAPPEQSLQHLFDLHFC